MMPPPRLLKIFVTQIGLHETIVATTSQRAALKAWGADRDLFGRGRAFNTLERGAYEVALENPGQVFARPAGSDKPFKPVSEAQNQRAATREDDGSPK